MKHRVHFSYWLNGGVWFYRFIGEGIVPLGAVRKTRDADVIKGIAERGGGLANSEAVCMLDFGLKQGQGGMYLMLDDAQLARVKR